MWKTIKGDVALSSGTGQYDFSSILRGGRMTKVAGAIVSPAPCSSGTRPTLSACAIVFTAAMSLPSLGKAQATTGCFVNSTAAVTCAGQDTNGFFAPNDVSSVTVDSGVRVDDLATGGTGADGDPSLSRLSVVKIDGNVDGDVTNNGNVAATELNVSAIKVEDINGQFMNNGRLSGQQTVETDDIYGGFVNRGAIYGTGEVEDEEGSFTEAVDVGDVTNGFANSGTIEALVTVDPTADFANRSRVVVDGVEIDDVDGDFINSGAITATSTVSSNYEHFDQYDLLQAVDTGDITGNFTNSGVITGNATLGLFADAVEVGEIGGDFTNSGTISASGIIGARTDAIQTEDITGNFTNTGTITATAIVAGDLSSPFSGEVEAVETDDIDGNFTNSGTISATATTGFDSIGVEIRNLAGNFSNSGKIISRVVASASASTPSPEIDQTVCTPQLSKAHAVCIENLQGSFSNNGTIIAETDGAGAPFTTGVYLRKLSGTIDGLGTIRASGDGDVYAVYIESGAGTLNASSADDVQGLIRVDQNDVNIEARGGSAVFAFEDNTASAATFTTTASSKSSAWFVQDEGGTFPVYVAVDGSDLTPSSDLVAFFGSVIGDSSAPSFGSAGQIAQGGLGGGLRPYASFDLQYSGLNEMSGAENSVTLSNAQFGLAGQMGTGATLHFGIGVISASGNGNGTELDTTGYYLNAAMGQTIGAFDLEAGIGFGWLSTDQTLAVGGIANPQSEFDSRVFTAHIAAEREFNMGQGFRLLGFANARYTSQRNEGYTATLAGTSATIGKVTTDVVEVAFGAAAQKRLSHGGILMAKLSGIWRQQLGDSQVGVDLFATSETLSVAFDDFKGASIEVGYEKDLSSGLRLQLSAEHEIGANAQGPNIRVGLNWTF
jgi:hypothetical protein